MRSAEENMDSLSHAILSEAHAEADKVLTDAKAKAEATRQKANKQAESVTKEILDRASQETERIRSQKIAATQLKARTMQLDSREKMLNKVFSEALNELPSIQQWTDYEDIAQSLLREAIAQLRTNEVTVHADSKTREHFSQQFLDDLSKELNVQINLGDPLTNDIGVIVESANGHLQFDNTLETRLKRMWNNMRSAAYHRLMGEQL